MKDLLANRRSVIFIAAKPGCLLLSGGADGPGRPVLEENHARCGHLTNGPPSVPKRPSTFTYSAAFFDAIDPYSMQSKMRVEPPSVIVREILSMDEQQVTLRPSNV